MNRLERLDIVGLFPPIGEQAVGGIEAIGRLAWATLVAQADRPTYLISYGPGQLEQRDGTGLATASRSKALLTAGSLAFRAKRALVWHLGLSPLLPVLKPARRGSAVYLHGFEAWRPVPRSQRAALMLTRPLLLTHVEMTLHRFLAANPWARNLRAKVVAPGVRRPLDGPTPDPAGSPAAVMVGRLLRDEDYKGHREVISAWPAVAAAQPGAELWVIGDGDLLPDLQALAREKGVAGHVRFLGRLSDDARDERIAAARCLALPSRGEGFGLVYLEAMRFGRPCLVSTLDSGRYVVDPPAAGLAVDPSDPRQVESALIRLLTPGPDWSAWSHAARHRYETLYTEEAFESRLLEAWQLVG